jgi:hypothetical protein
MSNENRVRISCADGHHSNGGDVLMAEIGFKQGGQPAEYLWCKLHRRAHACTLEQQLQTYREISASNPSWRQQYMATLNKAILDVMMDCEDSVVEHKQESA